MDILELDGRTEASIGYLDCGHNDMLSDNSTGTNSVSTCATLITIDGEQRLLQ